MLALLLMSFTGQVFATSAAVGTRIKLKVTAGSTPAGWLLATVLLLLRATHLN